MILVESKTFILYPGLKILYPGLCRTIRDYLLNYPGLSRIVRDFYLEVVANAKM